MEAGGGSGLPARPRRPARRHGCVEHDVHCVGRGRRRHETRPDRHPGRDWTLSSVIGYESGVLKVKEESNSGTLRLQAAGVWRKSDSGRIILRRLVFALGGARCEQWTPQNAPSFRSCCSA